MQTKSIVLVNALAALTSAVAIPEPAAVDSVMPTLNGPNWYDWSATSIATSAAAVVASSSASSSSQSQWGQWTPSSAVAVVSSSTAAASSWAPVWTPATVAVVSTSSYKYENPFTVYTSQTNSWGVITGMPSVVTSQPAVVTSQPTQPVPAGWTTASVPSAASTQTIARFQNTTLSTVSSGTATGFQQTKTASVAVATKTGNAAAVGVKRVTGAGVAIVALGFGFSLL